MKDKNTPVDNSKDITLQMIHTDQLGNKWYQQKNLLELSPSRGLSAARADRYVGLRISEGNMKELLKVAIEGVNGPNPNIVQAIAILHELHHRTEFMSEQNSILDLSAVYFFLEDENPDFPSEAHNEKKRDIWAKDEVCRDFFLHMGIGLTKQFSGTSEEDLLKFIRNTMGIAERIYQFIPRT